MLDANSLAPTPTYNAAITEDLSSVLIMGFVKDDFERCPVLKDATILLKVWLTQNGHLFSFDGIDGNYSCILVCHLYRKGRIYSRMTAVNAFKVCVNFLAIEFSEHYLHAFSGDSTLDLASQSAGIYVSALGKEGKEVLINITSRISLTAHRAIQNDAKIALKNLGDAEDSCFETLFMKKKELFDRYDIIFYIPSISTVKLWSKDLVSLTPLEHLATCATTVLLKALAGRATQLRVLPLFESSLDRSIRPINWSLSAKCPKENESGICICISLDHEGCQRRVERGTDTENLDAQASFRALWGPDRITLRRFQDGSITEAVVWNANDDEKYIGSVVEEVLIF